MRAPPWKRWSYAVAAGALLAGGSTARAEEAVSPPADAAAPASAEVKAEPAAVSPAKAEEPKKDEAKQEQKPEEAKAAEPVAAPAEPKKEEAKVEGAAVAVPAPETKAAAAVEAPAALPVETPKAVEPAPAPVVETPRAAAPPVAGVPKADDVKSDQPPKYGGFMFDLSLYESSGLNTLNYNNQGAAYFEPMWSVGKAFLANSPFKNLTINGRWVLTRTFAGYDPTTVHPTGDLGYAPRCSNISQSSNGTLDPATVQRCATSADYRFTSGDTWLTVANPGLYTIPEIGVKVNPSVRFVLPTSIESQYATLRLATAATVNLSKSFFDHQLTLAAAFGGTKYFHKYTSPGADTAEPPTEDGPVTANYRQTQIGGNSTSFYADPSRDGTGHMNPSFGLSQIVSADWMPIPKLTVSVLYIWLHSFAYEQEQCMVTVGGKAYDACQAADSVAKRSNGVGIAGRAVSDTQIFWATAQYQLEPWVALSLAWINAAPQRKEDNSTRQGFISTDYNAFTNVSLGATFSFNRPDEG